MKNEKWYVRRLAAYCGKHYSEYEDEMEFYVDPSPRQWLFCIPSTKEKVLLTCDDNGKITQKLTTIPGA